MGLRGPPPKPAALKLLEGNRGHRPISELSVKSPEVKEPSMPSHLCPDARKEWKRIMPLLLELGLVSEADRSALALYCQAWGRTVELERDMSRLVVAKRKEGSASPVCDAVVDSFQLQNALRKHREECFKSLQQFGLTPSSRTRAVPSKPKNTSSGSGWGAIKRA